MVSHEGLIEGMQTTKVSSLERQGKHWGIVSLGLFNMISRVNPFFLFHVGEEVEKKCVQSGDRAQAFRFHVGGFNNSAIWAWVRCQLWMRGILLVLSYIKQKID